MTDDAPDSRRDSRWWYVIATVPVIQTLWILAFLVAVVPMLDPAGGHTVAGFDAATAVLVLLFVPTILVTLALPVALYQDITLLESHDAGPWVPDRDRYVIAAAAGIFVPGLSIGVSVYHLYRRHVHHGIP